MANNKIQVKRTNVAGRTANVTNVANTQYIDAGEFALNMADGILYSSNGSALIEIGSNNSNASVTGNLTIKGVIANGSIGSNGQVLTSNGTSTYWSTVSAGPGGSVNVDAQYTWTNTQTFTNTITFTATINATANNATYLGGKSEINLNVNNALTANLASYVVANSGIVSNAFGVFVNSAYIATLSANNASYLGTVAAASYVQNTDSRTLSGNLNFTGSNTYFTSGWFSGANVIANTTALFVGNSTVNAVVNQTTLSLQTNTTVNSSYTASLVQVANSTAISNLVATGLIVYTNSTVNATHSASLLQVSNSTGTANLTAVDLKVGTTVVNTSTFALGTSFTANSSVVNATSYNIGTFVVANSSVVNATHLAGVAAASYVQNTDSRTLSGNLNFTGTNTYFTAGWFSGANVVANTTALFVGNSTVNATQTQSSLLLQTNTTVNATHSASLLQVANSTGTANLTAVDLKVGTTVVNTSTFALGTSFTANSSVVNATAYNIGTFVVANSSVVNATHLAGVASASYVQNTDTRTLSGNLNFTGTNTYFTAGWFSGANVIANTTALFVGNSTVNVIQTQTTFTSQTNTTVNSTQTATLLQVANSTSIANVVATGLQVYTNSTVNSTVSATLIQIANSTATSNLTPTALNVGSGATVNTLGFWTTGTINAATHSVGTSFIANSTQLTLAAAVGFSANGSLGSNGNVLTSNGTAIYWGTSSSGGSVYLKGGTSTVGTLAVEGQNLFRVNANTMNNDTTIAAGENAQATGPINIATGKTLTIQTGGRVSIV